MRQLARIIRRLISQRLNHPATPPRQPWPGHRGRLVLQNHRAPKHRLSWPLRYPTHRRKPPRHMGQPPPQQRNQPHQSRPPQKPRRNRRRQRDQNRRQLRGQSRQVRLEFGGEGLKAHDKITNKISKKRQGKSAKGRASFLHKISKNARSTMPSAYRNRVGSCEPRCFPCNASC